MIETDYYSITNFDNAIRGMRNPLESWDSMDSRFGMCFNDDEYAYDRLVKVRDAWMDYDSYGQLEDMELEIDKANWEIRAKEVEDWLWESSLLEKDGPYENRFYFGPKDLKLAQNLIRAGADESKFMRQIFVSVDITAPLYWWKEMDTYKVGTVANSTSTMHKLTLKPFTINDFSFDEDWDFEYNLTVGSILKTCENLRQKYIKTNNKRYWRALIQLLPESYNQTRTWTANYAVLRNIYFARRNHKLQEWRDFCSWIETLPYAKELICLEEKKDK